MNRTGLTTSLLALAALAAAATGCAREDEPVSTTSVTSTTVAAPAAPATTTEEGQASLVCEGTTPGEALAPPVTLAPTSFRATRRSMKAAPREKGAAASVRAASMPLDEAIEATVKQDATQAVAPSPPEPIAAIGATLPAAAPSSGLAPARITFANRLPHTYELQRVRLIVDGATTYDAPRADTLQVPPGDHLVQVIADYRLNDPVFTYVDAYKVEVQQMQFVAGSRTPTDFVATAIPTGGVTTPIEKRAALDWRAVESR